VHRLVSDRLAGDYHVLYAHAWKPTEQVRQGGYASSYLKTSYVPYRGRHIYVNLDVWRELDRLDPEIVITTGFTPTYLFAVMWCIRRKRQHIPLTDGWLRSEQNLTFVHRRVRAWVYRHSCAFLGASKHTLDLYRHYKVPDDALFQSHLCADNQYYAQFVGAEPRYDIMFCGRMIPGKLPQFFVEVATQMRARKPDLEVLVLGDGPERAAMLTALDAGGVRYTYAGFVSQADLPAHYASARVLLFPTLQECWGVVANEACAVGVPVITCPNAGAAGDLILHGANGFVLELDVRLWAEHALRLLADPSLRAAFSSSALERVQSYNFEQAALGILAAVDHCSAAAKPRNGAA
jgi:glycosyltransferase involved in cell wall biosynthesis